LSLPFWTNDAIRVNETIQERKRPVVQAAIVFTIALALRLHPGAQIPPFDDVYHLKRIENPRILEKDPDRGEQGAFCPWPPLYDEAMRLCGGSSSAPPIFFAAFAALLTIVCGPIAGLTVAVSPYLIGISSTGHIDHHYVEPLLVLLIVAAAAKRRGVLLGLAIALALLVQTALFVAAGLAFVALFFGNRDSGLGIRTRESRIPNPESRAFALAALIVVVFRLTRLPAYPDSAWFLGYPHAALLAAAAIACALRDRVGRVLALVTGGAFALAMPSTSTAFLTGVHFFGGDPWLSTIVEFQPLLHHPSEIGTDVANLTGGALLGLLLWRKERTVAIFSTAYLVLAISSRRFLVPAIALFAVSGALAFAYARRRSVAWIFALLTVLPPIAYDIYTFRSAEPSNEEFRVVGERMRALPRGRVLGPWSFGHAIDVIGQKPVVIDNFGSMPDERVFTQAIEAMLTTHAATLLDYCHTRGVRYLVLPHPAYVPATAVTIGVPPELYSSTRLAGRTVWARLYGGEKIPGFTLVSDGALQIWMIE